MVRISFQILVSVAVLGLGAVVQLRFLHEPVRDWKDILRRINSLDGRLVEISHDDVFSEGLSVPANEIYESIDGWRGLLAICQNIAALTEIPAYLTRMSTPSSRLKRVRLRLFAKAAKATLLTVIALAASPLPVALKILLSFPAASAYISLVANTCIAVKDHCPQVMPQLERSLREGPG